MEPVLFKQHIFSSMILKIDGQNPLRNAQQQFNSFYPYLKIEFFRRIPADLAANSSELVSAQGSPGWARIGEEGFIKIDVNRKKTVSEVESEVEQTLGLMARIYRKSGNVWVETTLTNDWPLEDQNEEGRQISSHFLGSKE